MARTGRPVNYRLQQAAPEEAWKQLAVCRGVDPGVFYDGVRPEQAKRMCALCSVKRACLEYALAVEEFEGIWGGLTGEERQLLLRERERGTRMSETDEVSP